MGGDEAQSDPWAGDPQMREQSQLRRVSTKSKEFKPDIRLPSLGILHQEMITKKLRSEGQSGVPESYRKNNLTVKGRTQNLTGLPWWLSGKECACSCRRCRFDFQVRMESHRVRHD